MKGRSLQSIITPPNDMSGALNTSLAAAIILATSSGFAGGLFSNGVPGIGLKRVWKRILDSKAEVMIVSEDVRIEELKVRDKREVLDLFTQTFEGVQTNKTQPFYQGVKRNLIY